jgi:membrane dipeptidase
MKRPIIDIHCDLLIYLTKPFSNIKNKEDIGCSVPYLKEGNVKLQVMAIYTPTQIQSHTLGIEQSQIFNTLVNQENDFYAIKKHHLENIDTSEKLGMLASLENASAFCDEKISLKQGFKNLETIISNVGNLFYIGLTHHTENRFGGGNNTIIGLKKDGKELLDYLDNKNIAIDFSHTSDALAHDILNYISRQNINVSIIASHSNYRTIFNHPRNLPNEIAKEIINKQGLIGVNFLRAFVNNENPNALYDHISYGIDLGGKDSICYGADYFYHLTNPDKSRIPFFFEEHENATCYQQINNQLAKQFDDEFCDQISNKNVTRFLLNNLLK